MHTLLLRRPVPQQALLNPKHGLDIFQLHLFIYLVTISQMDENTTGLFYTMSLHAVSTVGGHFHACINAYGARITGKHFTVICYWKLESKHFYNTDK